MAKNPGMGCGGSAPQKQTYLEGEQGGFLCPTEGSGLKSGKKTAGKAK